MTPTFHTWGTWGRVGSLPLGSRLCTARGGAQSEPGGWSNLDPLTSTVLTGTGSTTEVSGKIPEQRYCFPNYKIAILCHPIILYHWVIFPYLVVMVHGIMVLKYLLSIRVKRENIKIEQISGKQYKWGFPGSLLPIPSVAINTRTF